MPHGVRNISLVLAAFSELALAHGDAERAVPGGLRVGMRLNVQEAVALARDTRRATMDAS